MHTIRTTMGTSARRVWIACTALAFAIPGAPRAARADDPVAECIAASEKGQTERDAGKYRAARADFAQCARDVCPRVVTKACNTWVHDLDATAPTLVLGARDEQGHDLEDVTVTFDGEPFATRLDGSPIEVDGGPHVLRFERAGCVPVEQRIVLRAGEKARVVTVTLASEASTIPAPAPPPPVELAPEPLLSARHVTSATLMLGALGAAGTGLAFALQANQQSQNASRERGGLPPNACAQTSSAFCASLSQTVDSQHADTNLATALFVGAGALAVASIATWWLWPSRTEVSQPTTGGVMPVRQGAVVFLQASLP
jgi:hypothetical protein